MRPRSQAPGSRSRPRPRPRSRFRFTALPVVIVLVAVVLSCGAIENDEMNCEEAAARVEECCPRFDARRTNCLNQPSGNCNGRLVPIFTARASSCLRGKSCGDIEGAGSCDVFRQMSFEPTTSQVPSAFEQEACK